MQSIPICSLVGNPSLRTEAERSRPGHTSASSFRTSGDLPAVIRADHNSCYHPPAIDTRTIITGELNELPVEIHTRKPVILPETLLDRGFDVLVQAKEVLGVVLLLDGHEAVVVGTVGSFDRVFSLLA